LFSKKDNTIENPIGGQALIEGVMMRGKDAYSIALLKKSGEISVTKIAHKSIGERYKIFKTPFIRGIGALWDSLKIGIKSLMFSANEAIKEEEEINPPKKKKKNKKGDTTLGVLLSVVSIIFAFLLFVAVPNVLIHLIGINETSDPVIFNILSGIMRILIFVAYVFAISLMNDIKRVFQFHGAEHKAVNAYEAGKPVEMDTVKTFTTFHPRCGTSFMLFVLVIAIFVFSFVPIFYRSVIPGFANFHIVINKAIIILTHFALLPVVAGISYELIKLTYKGRNNIFLKIIALPGYGLQKITTREPDENQLKCAIAAINELLKKDDDKKDEEAA